jgi:hypothetical protein
VLHPSAVEFVFLFGCFEPFFGPETVAKVRYATEEDYFDVPVGNVDWNRRWTAPTGPRTGEPTEEETQNPSSGEATEAKPLMDRMIVTPEAPLTADQDWHLEIAAGLKSVSGNRLVSSEQL